MSTVTFYLICCAILGINDATALSLRASSLQYNVSSKSILTTSGAFPRYENSSISSKTFPTAPSAHIYTVNNDTVVTNTSSLSACCFVVQDTIDARYWAGYLTYTTVISNRTTSLITFATKYIDTIVTTDVSTVIRTRNHTSNVTSSVVPTIPNTHNKAPRPSLRQIGLNRSSAMTVGATITSPTQFYVFPSVNIINVPAVSDEGGRLVCATTSTYRATCPAQTSTQNALYITGINSNAESYFTTGPSNGSAMISLKFDMVRVSFSRPFIHVPLRDQFPSGVVNENLGYVPQTLIEWMAQDSDYVSRFPGIASCLPGGPSVDFSSYFCPFHAYAEFILGTNLDYQVKEPDLIVSSTVTVAGKGCFHPGACSTPAAAGAAAVAVTPDVTREAETLRKVEVSSAAQAQDTSSPISPKNLQPAQAPGPPVPTQAETPANTPVISPENQAVNSPANPLPGFPSPLPPEAANESPSVPKDSSGNPSVDSSENSQGANPPPNNPAKPLSSPQAFGVIIASAIGNIPTSSPDSQDNQASPGPTPIPGYSISIAPSASAVVINGVTSVLPAGGSEGLVTAGIVPIAVGSQQISQNAASQYVVAGQTITPGAPPINIQGTEVSLALSASAIVIAGSTIALSSTSVPGFTVGAEIVTANSASQYVVSGQTLVPGGPAVTVSGTRLSLGPSGTQVVIGSSTIALGPTFMHPPPPLTLGSQTYTANSNSEYTIAGQTLTPGGPAITVSGTRLSLAPSATQVIIGSSTIGLVPIITPPPLKFGSQTFTANSISDYIIDGQTLIPGAPAITVSGTPISLAPGATQVVIGSSTIDLTPTTTPPLITFDSQTFTANSLSDYIIDGQTLIPGAPAITVSGTPISLAPDASEVVIGGITEILHPDPTLPPITIGLQTFTANNAGAYVIGGQTITPGAPGIIVPGSILNLGTPGSVFTVAGEVFTANPTAFSIDGTRISAGGPGVTISGTPISLLASGVLDIGNSTITLSAATSTNNGLGLGGFTGGGDRTALGLLYSVLALVLSLLIVAVL